MNRPLTACFSLLLLASFAICIPGCKRNPTQSTAALKPGYHATAAPPPAAPFDYYRLRMDWAPELCRAHPSSPVCSSKTGFVMTAFAPENNDGTAPTRCHDLPFDLDPARFKDLTPDPAALQQTWEEHGTCTGLVPVVYFQLAQKARAELSFPPLVTTTGTEETLQTERVRSRLRFINGQFENDQIAVLCSPDHHLTAVEACFTKDLDQAKCSKIVHPCTSKLITVEPEKQ